MKQGWASIASLNISKRKKTNTLENRLENVTGSGCSLEVHNRIKINTGYRMNFTGYSIV